MIHNDRRFGFVAVFGATNSGKSTLINHLVGSKVSIVSHKVQTTRRRLLGITIKDQTQICFVDTPGLFIAHHSFDKAMVEAALQAHHEADLSLIIIDGVKPKFNLIEEYAKAIQGHTPIAVVINKIDLIDKTILLTLVDQLKGYFPISEFFFISALKGLGCDALTQYLTTQLPKSVWHYPEDQISDLPLKYLAAEVTREKIYQFLHQELPYAIHVNTDAWEDFKNGDVKITQTLYVERNNQKSIVVGHQGKMLKMIGQTARLELGKILERKVHLNIHIKVDENWRTKKSILEQYGFA